MNESVACSLRPDDLDHRIHVWREFVSGHLLGRESTDDGYVVALRPAPGVAAEARRLAGQEGECCPWMRVQVTDGEVVTISFNSSRPGGPEEIRRLFQTG